MFIKVDLFTFKGVNDIMDQVMIDIIGFCAGLMLGLLLIEIFDKGDEDNE